jgi:hypothetical protein
MKSMPKLQGGRSRDLKQMTMPQGRLTKGDAGTGERSRDLTKVIPE